MKNTSVPHVRVFLSNFNPLNRNTSDLKINPENYGKYS